MPELPELPDLSELDLKVDSIDNKIDDLINDLKVDDEDIKDIEDKLILEEEKEEALYNKIDDLSLSLDEIFEQNLKYYDLEENSFSTTEDLIVQNQQILTDNSIIIENLQNINGLIYSSIVVLGAVLILMLLYNVLRKFFY